MPAQPTRRPDLRHTQLHTAADRPTSQLTTLHVRQHTPPGGGVLESMALAVLVVSVLAIAFLDALGGGRH